MKALTALVTLLCACGLLQGCASRSGPWPLPQPYVHQDAWSTPSQREGWIAWLNQESKTPVVAQYDPVGHLHGLAANIPLTDASAAGVLNFLEGSIRQQLGVRPEERLRIVSTFDFGVPVFKNGRLIREQKKGFRVVVEFAEYREIGRDMIVVVNPATKTLDSLFNGHIPSLGQRATAVPRFRLQDATDVVATAEAGAVTVVSSALGWYSPDWIEKRLAGGAVLAWILKVETPSRNPRDYIVNAVTGEVLARSPDRYYLVQQDHQGFVRGGRTYFTTLPGGGDCPPSTNPPSYCREPAYSDSLKSRDFLPAITNEVEQLTTPGYPGISGIWKIPERWTSLPQLQPYQNKSSDPNTAALTVVISRIWEEDFCGMYPPPCSDQHTHVYGEGDVDASVYGHEYAHWLFAQTKHLVSQYGASGQVTEGVMDIAGVSFENAFLARRAPCPEVDGCTSARTDFVLTAPSQYPPLTIDMKGDPPSCTYPRAWLGNSFVWAAGEFALDMVGDNCPPNALCSLPGRGGHAREQDVALEVMFSVFLDVFDTTPDMAPKPSDVLAASAALSPSPPPPPGVWDPAYILHQKLQTAVGPTACQ